MCDMMIFLAIKKKMETTLLLNKVTVGKQKKQ